MIGSVLENPHRVGKQLRAPLDDRLPIHLRLIAHAGRRPTGPCLRCSIGGLVDD
jgi:hypothetical protein